MHKVLIKGAKRLGIILASSVLALSFTAASLVSLVQPQVASALSCPQDTPAVAKTNVLYCGLDGSSVANAVQSFTTAYKNNSDGHGNTDIQAVYSSAVMGGASLSSIVADTNFSGSLGSQGWAIGSSHSDGTLWVNNTQVNSGNSMEIYSRCEANMGNCQPTTAYHHVEGNVYWHYANFYFGSNSTVPTLVHFGSNGQVDLAMWIPCGNIIFIVPQTPPVHQLVCKVLTSDEVDNNILVRKFTAQATEQNVTITDYTFDFGNGTVKDYTVTQAATSSANTYSFTATDTQTYSQTSAQQTINTKVTVKGADFSNNCTTSFVIPPKTVTPSLVCVQITPPVALDTAQSQYKFTVTAQASNTDIKSYTFVYDNDTTNTETVNVTNNSNTATSTVHTFTPGTHTIAASVTGSLGTVTANTCKASITVPPLVKTGPEGIFGIFAATSALGTAFHRFVLRRKSVA